MFKDFIWAKLSGGEFATQGRDVDIFRREPYLLSRGEGVGCWLSGFKCLFHEFFSLFSIWRAALASLQTSCSCSSCEFSIGNFVAGLTGMVKSGQ